MKSKLTTEQKQYRDQRDRKIINMISPFAVLLLGTWMLASPTKPKHASIEKATTALVKDLWGREAGMVLLSLGILWLFFAIRGYLKFKNMTPKP